ncbi:hypothetical protein SUGI_1046470 [Cryptomeria japonica]|nr:hypothetical protein SUGI_1046470 [Cryptomeria japonica]
MGKDVAGRERELLPKTSPPPLNFAFLRETKVDVELEKWRQEESYGYDITSSDGGRRVVFAVIEERSKDLAIKACEYIDKVVCRVIDIQKQCYLHLHLASRRALKGEPNSVKERYQRRHFQNLGSTMTAI